MSMRKYDGTPIDLTWSNGPWANDGETVGSSDECSADGKITTTMEHNEYPRDKSVEERVEWVRQMMLNGSSYNELEKRCPMKSTTVERMAKGKDRYKGVDCPTPPLEYTRHGPGGGWVIADAEVDSTGEEERLPLDHVEKIRTRLLSGEKIYEVAGDYSVKSSQVLKAAEGSGKYESVNVQTPPLESTQSGLDGEWHVTEGVDGRYPKEAPMSTRIKWVRQMILDGNSTYEVAEKSPICKKTVHLMTKGDGPYNGVECSIPPLEHTTGGKGGEWVIADKHDSMDTEQANTGETEPEPAVEPEPMTAETTHTGYTPQETHSETNNTTRNALIGVVALIVGYLLGNRGDDE